MNYFALSIVNGPLAWLSVVRERVIKHVGRRQTEMKWIVYMNDVPVGRLPDDERARIAVDVLHDAGTYVAQVVNLCAVLARTVANVLVAASIVFAVLVLVDASLRSALISQEGRQALLMAGLSFNFLRVVFGTTFGFLDCFRQERERRIRLHCQVSALGRLELCLPFEAWSAEPNSSTWRKL